MVASVRNPLLPLALAPALLLPLAAADPFAYVGVGPVVVPPGHLDPGDPATGFFAVVRTLTLRDDTFDPVGATYCQDRDGDAACLAAGAGDVVQAFCGTLQLNRGHNWDPARPVVVWVDGGDLAGQPLTCGAATLGTRGVVDHD